MKCTCEGPFFILFLLKLLFRKIFQLFKNSNKLTLEHSWSSAYYTYTVVASRMSAYLRGHRAIQLAVKNRSVIGRCRAEPTGTAFRFLHTFLLNHYLYTYTHVRRDCVHANDEAHFRSRFVLRKLRVNINILGFRKSLLWKFSRRHGFLF